MLTRLLFAVFTVPLLMACDPTYFFALTNHSSTDMLVRSVWIANVAAGLADPVRPARAGETIWVVPARTGAGPDAIEVLTTDCRVVYSMTRPGPGTATVDAILTVTFDQRAPTDSSSSPDAVDVCPNR